LLPCGKIYLTAYKFTVIDAPGGSFYELLPGEKIFLFGFYPLGFATPPLRGRLFVRVGAVAGVISDDCFGEW
jgi:hypothetical protein